MRVKYFSEEREGERTAKKQDTKDFTAEDAEDAKGPTLHKPQGWGTRPVALPGTANEVDTPWLHTLVAGPTSFLYPNPVQ
jgi:hypothetical protein